MSKLFLMYSFLVGLSSIVSALPIGHTMEMLERRMPQRTIIGYRAVNKQVAEAYNKAGTLTNVPASGVQTGEGAYLTAGLGEYKGVPDTHWHCVVFADPAEIASAPKLWIPEADSNKLPLFFKSNEKNLRSYIEQNHMHPDEALLFSWIEGHKPPIRQMLIPAMYLLGNNGQKSLGISVTCVDPANLHTLPDIIVPWQTWGISGFQ